MSDDPPPPAPSLVERVERLEACVLELARAIDGDGLPTIAEQIEQFTARLDAAGLRRRQLPRRRRA